MHDDFFLSLLENDENFFKTFKLYEIRIMLKRFSVSNRLQKFKKCFQNWKENLIPRISSTTRLRSITQTGDIRIVYLLGRARPKKKVFKKLGPKHVKLDPSAIVKAQRKLFDNTKKPTNQNGDFPNPIRRRSHRSIFFSHSLPVISLCDIWHQRFKIWSNGFCFCCCKYGVFDYFRPCFFDKVECPWQVFIWVSSQTWWVDRQICCRHLSQRLRFAFFFTWGRPLFLHLYHFSCILFYFPGNFVFWAVYLFLISF